MNHELQTATRPGRRFWPRFTLRVVLAVVTAVGIGLGIWTHRAREQRRVVERIENGGGYVNYHFQFEMPSGRPRESPVPRWLLNSFGVNFFHDVSDVGTSDISVLKELHRFRRLERLIFGNSAVSDKDLTPLSQLCTLRDLTICGNELPVMPHVGDRTLELIAMLPALESVYVSGAGITPEGLSTLAQSRALTRVNIWCSNSAIEERSATPFRMAGRVHDFNLMNLAPNVGGNVARWNSAGSPPVAAAN